MGAITVLLALAIALLSWLLFKKYLEERTAEKKTVRSVSAKEATIEQEENTSVPSVTGITSLLSSGRGHKTNKSETEINIESTTESAPTTVTSSNATVTTNSTSESTTTSTLTTNTGRNTSFTSPKLLFGRSIQDLDTTSTRTAKALTSLHELNMNKAPDSSEEEVELAQISRVMANKIPPWELERYAYDPENFWKEQKQSSRTTDSSPVSH